MLPIQYTSTINIGVLDGQYLILLLVLKHYGMASTKIKINTVSIMMVIANPKISFTVQ